MTEAELVAELTEWLEEHWDPEQPVLEWRHLLVAAGWLKPSWAREHYGRGLPAWADRVALDTIRHFGAVGPPTGGGFMLAAPTMMNHGSPELCDRYLFRTLTGELTWTQLFSEPGNGSDLAGLTTTAVRDGDTWIVNGQKVWSTSAHHADMAFIVTRTDWDAPKHKGITFFMMNMDQPGIEVRGIRQMNFHSSFNEIFIADAEIPDVDRVGDVGDGWRVAKTTLSYERSLGGLRPKLVPHMTGRCWDEANAETREQMKVYSWYPQRAGQAAMLTERAQKLGVNEDPLIRQEIAAVESFKRVSEWTASRGQAARAMGRKPGPEGSIGKLAASRIAKQSALVHTRISGAEGMLAGSDPRTDEIVAEVLLSTPAVSIAGGTDEIQHNILGENMLGLPREPGFSRDTPFREIPRN